MSVKNAEEDGILTAAAFVAARLLSIKYVIFYCSNGNNLVEPIWLVFYMLKMRDDRSVN